MATSKWCLILPLLGTQTIILTFLIVLAFVSNTNEETKGTEDSEYDGKLIKFRIWSLILPFYDETIAWLHRKIFYESMNILGLKLLLGQIVLCRK